MRVQELFDIDKYIKINDIQEVTSQKIFGSGSGGYDPNGLMSERIFGQTENERSYRCGYIKLPIFIFNPTIAKSIISRGGGIIKKCAYGECKCNLKNGVLVVDKEGPYCGIKDLYTIWDKIDIPNTLQSRNVDNINILIKSPKRLIWTNKLLVLPCNFRPVGIKNGRQTRNELNTIYQHIIGLKSITAHTTTDTVYQLYNKFQEASLNIYNYIKNYVSSKNGFFQKALLTKNTVWTARNVISAPRYNEDDTPIGIFRTGYPLHTVCSLFFPLVRFQMKQFLSFNNIQQIHVNPNEVNRNMIESVYDDKTIEDLMNIYMKNPGSRFKILYLDDKNEKPIIINGFNITTNQPIQRQLTLTDAIYLCCKTVVEDANRMVYTVRYPIGDYLGAFFTQVHVLSTLKTIKFQFNGITYNYYPNIDLTATHRQVSISFADTLTMSNSRLGPLGADYDGDTVKSVGIFSDEANEEARRLMYSKVTTITAQCSSPFETDKECVMGLYGLTKD